MQPDQHFIIRISCKDRKGLVADVSSVLLGIQANIIEIEEYVEKEDNFFYMRCAIIVNQLNTGDIYNFLYNKLTPNTFELTIDISTKVNKKVVILCSKEPHCLADLLMRHHLKTFNMDVVAVVSNHNVLAHIAQQFNVPFYYVPLAQQDKNTFEKNMLSCIQKHHPDLIILAKFMQILSADFLHYYQYKIINIHHSLLPAFMGAHPYHKAFERGVKLVGATAHFVTSELDAGPIIVQQTTPIKHSYSIEKIKQRGYEVEKSVLAEAVKLFLQDSLFVHNNKTVVFES